jgi:hypothetical protein
MLYYVYLYIISVHLFYTPCLWVVTLASSIQFQVQFVSCPLWSWSVKRDFKTCVTAWTIWSDVTCLAACTIWSDVTCVALDTRLVDFRRHLTWMTSKWKLMSTQSTAETWVTCHRGDVHSFKNWRRYKSNRCLQATTSGLRLRVVIAWIKTTTTTSHVDKFVLN